MYLRSFPSHAPLRLKLVVMVGVSTLLHDELVYLVSDSVEAVAVYMVYVLSSFLLQLFNLKLSENRIDWHAASL